MAELGVSDTQFLEACQKAEANPVHKKIVDQIVAVESFLAFKKLMVKRNQELNKQAMELFNKKGTEATPTPEAATTTPASAAATTTDAAQAATATPQTEESKKKDAEDLKEVMRVAHNLERAEEEEMMKRALEESEKLNSEEQKVLTEEEEMIKQAIEMSERDEKERQAKLSAEGQLSESLQNASSAEAELSRQKTLLDQREKELTALMAENKRQKE